MYVFLKKAGKYGSYYMMTCVWRFLDIVFAGLAKNPAQNEKAFYTLANNVLALSEQLGLKSDTRPISFFNKFFTLNLWNYKKGEI